MDTKQTTKKPAVKKPAVKPSDTATTPSSQTLKPTGNESDRCFYLPQRQEQ